MRIREAVTLLVLLAVAAPVRSARPIDVGTDLQLLVDTSLIDRVTAGARLELHHPVAREVALVTDRPWEGNAVNYVTVFQDGPLYRMYYRGADVVYTRDA